MTETREEKILLIQTAFIGDVILATALVEKLHSHFPKAKIDFLLRKGNESLLEGHPHLHEVLVFDKKKAKYKNLWNLLKRIRRVRYDKVINVQRFFTTGLITAFSKGKCTIGFDKNPWSFSFSRAVPHDIGLEGGVLHETDRNQRLITTFTDAYPSKPCLYPQRSHYEGIKTYQKSAYICIAPTSVWFTKQFPPEKWLELVKELPQGMPVYLLGAPGDVKACEAIRSKLDKGSSVEVLAGRLDLLASAALMEGAVMNFVNDSAPLHLCSAMDAPTCAIFCSTVPRFGFGPLSSRSCTVEVQESLSCRPCGLHGHRSCPEGHFRCAYGIGVDQLMQHFRHLSGLA